MRRRTRESETKREGDDGVSGNVENVDSRFAKSVGQSGKERLDPVGTHDLLAAFTAARSFHFCR